MSREIYTYTDLTKLYENENYKEIKHHPHVTASSELSKAIGGSKDQEDTHLRITDIHKIAQAMDNDWGTDQSKFKEIILLSEYIRKKMKDASSDKRQINWLTGCMRNIGSLMASITLLEQANIKPEDIRIEDDRNLDLMVNAWRYLAEKDPTIAHFRSVMSKEYTKEMLDPILQSAFSTEESFVDVDAIVFCGFYFITPLQERIMCLLENAGYKLIFLIHYDERYPFVHEIWEKTFSEERGYPPRDKWHIERSSEENPYGDIFEGKRDVSVNNRLDIKEYASEMEFVNDVNHIRKRGYTIYSSDSNAANDILRDYYPEEYGERKILSYPIGQFVSILNQMWDEEEETICLDEENLIECFSSGWLSLDGISGRQYLQDLMYIMPFFNGCHSIDLWTDRIELLKQIRQETIEPFLVDLDADESISRWQEAIGNPMANFSMFAVDTKRLDVILALIRQLLDMAKELFGKGQMIRVSNHINKLDHILKHHEISQEMYEEERQLVGEIFDKLGTPGDFDLECSPADISNALNVFMSGRYDEGEIQNDRLGLVYPIRYVDAVCLKHNAKVHICMCDVDSMPGGNKEYVWPLSSQIIEKCYEKTAEPLLMNLMHIMDSASLSNRYLMYCALRNDDVTISWIREIGDKILEASPYIKLVISATGFKMTPARHKHITFTRVAESGYGKGRIVDYDNDKMPSGIIKEARMAYALCPMKYILGYVVEKFPTYQSEFQQTYALNAFISAIYDLMKEEGMTKDEIYKNIMDLFPGLRNVEKRQVYDYIEYDRREDDMDYRSRTNCGGYFYTDERIKIHYPNQQVREVTIGRYGKLMTPDGRKGMNLYETMEATDEEEVYGRKDIVKMACIFCPHIDYCRNAIYYGDQENFYD